MLVQNFKYAMKTVSTRPLESRSVSCVSKELVASNRRSQVHRESSHSKIKHSVISTIVDGLLVQNLSGLFYVVVLSSCCYSNTERLLRSQFQRSTQDAHRQGYVQTASPLCFVALHGPSVTLSPLVKIDLRKPSY